ncbi:uncharacterized protein BT62DRAFT_652174 [Guyanagaster necrorhizus]|uniref:Transmembrane protein n=1 Tax=Guyanagaster necrorhizus TaxID=856835 RepID=A0A9P7VH77_9AGAR|nr:uncharacterized protein BT62DRAFT_652174 [Guyanagaster necrorhizus MCA 3950]KAG7439904.1 hypothetical protein BT62DRAFT_652174 [Guyanagaster necrorhizus MCA 3950]
MGGHHSSGFGHQGSWHNMVPPSGDEGSGDDDSTGTSASNRKRQFLFRSDPQYSWHAVDQTRSRNVSPTHLIVGSYIVAIILFVIVISHIRRRQRRRARIESSFSEEVDVVDLEDQKISAAAED